MKTKTPTAKTAPKPVPRREPVEEPALTIREVAELDRCSERTVRRAIKSGLLDAMRIGSGQRLLRVTREAHERYRKRMRSGF